MRDQEEALGGSQLSTPGSETVRQNTFKSIQSLARNGFRKLNWKSGIAASSELSNYLRFADDVVLTANSITKLQEMPRELDTEPASISMQFRSVHMIYKRSIHVLSFLTGVFSLTALIMVIRLCSLHENSARTAILDDAGWIRISSKAQKKNIRILCYIPTTKKQHYTRDIFAKEFWVSKCDRYLFVSDHEDPTIPTVNFNFSAGKKFLWRKTRAALKYIYEKHYEEFDWLLKADNDAYVIMENLWSFLSSKNTQKPVYYGYRARLERCPSFIHGGACAISKAALKKFVTEALPDPNICPTGDSPSDDVELGRCLEGVGVEAGYTRDRFGRERFLPIPVHWLRSTKKTAWIRRNSYYPIKEVKNLASDYLISMHYVTPEMMADFSHLIYNFQQAGNWI